MVKNLKMVKMDYTEGTIWTAWTFWCKLWKLWNSETGCNAEPWWKQCRRIGDPKVLLSTFSKWCKYVDKVSKKETPTKSQNHFHNFLFNWDAHPLPQTRTLFKNFFRVIQPATRPQAKETSITSFIFYNMGTLPTPPVFSSVTLPTM